MLLTARVDYPDPGKRGVSAAFIHQIVFLFQCEVLVESVVVLRDGACAGSCTNGSGTDCRRPSRFVCRRISKWPRPHAERGQCLAPSGVCSTGLTANTGM